MTDKATRLEGCLATGGKNGDAVIRERQRERAERDTHTHVEMLGNTVVNSGMETSGEIITHWSHLSRIPPHQAPRPFWWPVRRRRLRQEPGLGYPHWGGHSQQQQSWRQKLRRWRGQSGGAQRGAE